jgi:hypothetical protein
MSVSFRPFKVADLDLIDIQDRHKPIIAWAKRFPLELASAENAWSFTATDAAGRVVCCAGVTQGRVWVCLAKDMKPFMIPVTKFCLAYIRLYVQANGPARADVDPTYPEAVRWAKLCGFRQVDEEVWVFE